MSTLLLIFVVIAICLAVLEFALLFKHTSEHPPGSRPTEPGHKPPPRLWFLAMSAILFILAVFLIWSIVDTFVTPRPILIGFMGIVGTSYQISFQKLYDGSKITTVAVVVCSALQFQLYILLLHQPSEELLKTAISFLMLSFIAEYTTVLWVYLNVPQSTNSRVNIIVNLAKVFCAITIIAALVSQPLYRWGIVDLDSSLLIVTYTILTPILCYLLYKLKVALEPKQHRALPSLQSSVAGSNVTLSGLGTRRNNHPPAWPPRAILKR